MASLLSSPRSITVQKTCNPTPRKRRKKHRNPTYPTDTFSRRKHTMKEELFPMVDRVRLLKPVQGVRALPCMLQPGRMYTRWSDRSDHMLVSE